jgi:hypothetical protein
MSKKPEPLVPNGDRCSMCDTSLQQGIRMLRLAGRLAKPLGSLQAKRQLDALNCPLGPVPSRVPICPSHNCSTP